MLKLVYSAIGGAELFQILAELPIVAQKANSFLRLLADSGATSAWQAIFGSLTGKSPSLAMDRRDRVVSSKLVPIHACRRLCLTRETDVLIS